MPTLVNRVCAHCGRVFQADTSANKEKAAKCCGGACQKTNRRLRAIWNGMIRRCYDPKNDAHRYYGSRGIEVCAAWRESYEAFRDWSLANGYRHNLELDRRRSNGHYEPDNCRWTTRFVQVHNSRKRSTGKATPASSVFKGVSYCGTSRRWRMRCSLPGRDTIKRFDTELEAALAYDDTAHEAWGDGVMLNFPERKRPKRRARIVV